MSTTLLLFSCTLVSISHKTDDPQKLRIYALPGPAYSDGIIPAQEIAIRLINNDTNILPNYQLTLHRLATPATTVDALNEVLLLTTSTSTSSNTSSSNVIPFPFFLGPPFSSYSTVTAPAANAFHWSLMSSAATSVTLSDTESFPYYYRTIASDTLNVKGVIQLCLHFNWTSIAVIYTADVFGTYFANGITELANKHGIDSNIVTYGRDLDKYEYAVETVKKLDTFIVVLIAHADEILELFETLQDYDMAGFPYFYIGVNSWFDAGSIKVAGIQTYCKGLIGASSWFPEPDNSIFEKIFNDNGIHTIN